MATQPNSCIKMLKALADETRWRLVQVLLDEEATVTELTTRLKISQYNASKHLRILREAGIVHQERHGRTVQCSIVPAFRHKLSKGGSELDLGCCVFRFGCC